MRDFFHIIIALFFFGICCYGQNNKTKIKASLDIDNDVIKIQQESVIYNHSDSILSIIYLHNWTNSFKDNKTPLSLRLIENFKKQLYFADSLDRGYTTIKNLSVNYETVSFYEKERAPDILEIALKDPLKPKDSIVVNATYSLKIQDSKVTGYGKIDDGYHLRFWYLAPAAFQEEWILMSNLNLDDLYENATDFTIEIDIPKTLKLESNLFQYETKGEERDSYVIVGKEKTDVILAINPTKQFKTHQTKRLNVYTDIDDKGLSTATCETILNRHIDFIEKFLGTYPYKELYLDEVTQKKNRVYGLNQLPKFLSPFTTEFNWDIEMFKAISLAFIKNTVLISRRQEHWFADGLQNYLMLEYINTFYPDEKLLGKVSNNWFLKSYNLAKAKFNDKYYLAHQYVSRTFFDQALSTSIDSLSNFNRKIANKYKAGLGFKYLKEYVGDSVFNQSLQEFYLKHKTKNTNAEAFESIITEKTDKNLDWFFGEFINTNKKIDYTINEVKQTKDSLEITIKNKRNITTPVLLYTLKDREIISKTWVENVENEATITIAKDSSNKVALNYENIYPELNTNDNWKRLKKKIFNKPLKFTLVKDIDDPYYNQIFYQPDFNYNFYNGLILGLKIHNKPIIKRNLELRFSPYYATKSQSVIGKFSVIYNQFFEKTNIYQIKYGLAGATLDYAPNLSYQSLIPFVNVVFKRKNLRDATFENVVARVVNINKEVAPGSIKTDEDRYSIFSASYNYINPRLIDEVRYNFNFEYAKNFSKISADIRYRTLTSTNTQLDFRFFAGTFLNNKTTSDTFSFGLDFSNDYLFQLNYFGRSESTGLFRQQFIITEGGFKSVLPTRFANQWMMSFNSSIGLWRFVEFYNDVAFLKNRNNPVYFAYNNGIRLNFVHNILELYFPLYSNNGWEVSQPNYAERIRFTLSTQFRDIFNFIRRGFL